MNAYKEKHLGFSSMNSARDRVMEHFIFLKVWKSYYTLIIQYCFNDKTLYKHPYIHKIIIKIR